MFHFFTGIGFINQYPKNFDLYIALAILVASIPLMRRSPDYSPNPDCTMRRINLLLAFVAVIIVFASCQKEPANSPLPDASLKVKTYTVDVRSAVLGNSVTTYNLSYDGNNRLVSMIEATNPGNKFVYAYPSSAKYTMDLFIDNALEIHADYLLNGQSLIDSSVQYNSSADTITEKYVYNSAKQLTKLYEYDYWDNTSYLWNTTTYTYDGAGNLIKSQDTDDYVYTYEYYTDKVYLSPQLIPVTVAQQKANLLKKVTLAESGTVTGSATSTYTFDNKDRISTARTDYSDGDVVIKTFTYFD
jgi:YD repeat-containing protein